MGRQYSAGPQASRLAWYDRNAASKSSDYQADDVSPHALTTRVAYTCPAGKKAMVEVLGAECRRSAAATTVGAVLSAWRLTPSGGIVKFILMARLRTNTVDDKREKAIGSSLVLTPGDYIEGVTADGSTSGNIDYVLTYKATEFDA